MNLSFKKQNGFTLIEIVISIFLLSFALVAIFSAFSMIVISTSDIVSQLTGTYLAQEGIEIVRNIRDTNWIKMDDTCAGSDTCIYTWIDNLSPVCTRGCEADFTTNTINAGANSVMTQWSGTGRYLQIDSSGAGNGFYTYLSTASSTVTKFKRKIIITPVTDVDGVSDPQHIIKVVVQVSWDKKATIIDKRYLAGEVDPNGNCYPQNCITIEGTFYNWYYPNH